MTITRFGVSLDEEILKAFDQYVSENNFANRSHAIKKIFENSLVEKKWRDNQLVAGAVVMLYDHHKGDITTRLNDLQHDYFKVILSTQHFHLNHDNCLEIIAVKGTANILTELADKLIGMKGIKHGKLVMSATE
jgi:CopG family transcriptional regulator, nickel-responsive regulator